VRSFASAIHSVLHVAICLTSLRPTVWNGAECGRHLVAWEARLHPQPEQPPQDTARAETTLGRVRPIFVCARLVGGYSLCSQLYLTFMKISLQASQLWAGALKSEEVQMGVGALCFALPFQTPPPPILIEQHGQRHGRSLVGLLPAARSWRFLSHFTRRAAPHEPKTVRPCLHAMCRQPAQESRS
jgi:hypothetical protein